MPTWFKNVPRIFIEGGLTYEVLDWLRYLYIEKELNCYQFFIFYSLEY